MKNKKLLLLILVAVFCTLLISCGKKDYNVTYDPNGGVLTEDTFILGSGDVLSKPEKEGFFFVGWMEDETIIERLEARDYNLKALWVPTFNYEYIDDSEIFMQDELTYYVYLMRDGCSWCEKIKEDVLRYQYKANLNNKIEQIYVINLQTAVKNSIILRTYDSESSDGEGFFVRNALKWDDLYIPSTPTLLEIKEDSEHRYATLIASGATNIKETLRNKLVSDVDYSITTDIYSISYDLDGGLCNNQVTSFNKWENVLLPMPEKEGYYFGGWLENNQYIKSIDRRDYNLKASWVEESVTDVLEEDDIFSLDTTYYIYFLKESDDNSKMIEIIRKYNALANYYETGKVYLVNLEKCKVIYRAYVSDDASSYKVDGATSIDDMYISRKKSMIMIKDHVASFVGDSTKDIQTFLESLLSVSLSD